MPAGRLTIYDVAEKAGVSIATVSRVMNNVPSVSDRTRLRVLKLLDKTSYKPKVIKNKLPCIGALLEAEGLGADLFNNYNSLLLSGVSAYVLKHGLSLSICPFAARSLKRPDDIMRHLQERGIDGVVVVFHEGYCECLRALDKNVFPHFAIGCDASLTPHSSSFDEKAALGMAFDHMRALGRSRIGFVNVDNADDAHRKRLAAFMEVAGSRGCVDAERLVLTKTGYHAFHRKLGYETIMAFKDRVLDNPPDALICIDDDIGAGVLKALHELDVDVPGAISVIGFDNYESSEFTHPPLSSVSYPLYEMGYHAAESVHCWLNGGMIPSGGKAKPGLVVRGSSHSRGEHA